MIDQNQKNRLRDEFQSRLLKFSLSIISLCDSFYNRPKFKIIAGQLIRSATSIGANIVEAKSSCSRKEYIKYFQIALKSANETKYWLLITKEISKNPLVLKLLEETDELARILGSSIITLKNKKVFNI